MIFTNHRSQNSYIGNKILQSKPLNSNVNIFSILRPNQNIQPVVKSPVQIENTILPKKMKWGEPIWYFLHCLAEKIKEEAFPSMRSEILNIIYTICSNLPCQDCANHASEYLKSINYQSIQTKEQLKNMLFSFHNTINSKKNFTIFPRYQLESKYQNMQFKPVIYNFIINFQDKHKSLRMIANDFHKSRVVEQLKIWLNTNITNFYF